MQYIYTVLVSVNFDRAEVIVVASGILLYDLILQFDIVLYIFFW